MSSITPITLTVPTVPSGRASSTSTGSNSVVVAGDAVQLQHRVLAVAAGGPAVAEVPGGDDGDVRLGLQCLDDRLVAVIADGALPEAEGCAVDEPGVHAVDGDLPPFVCLRHSGIRSKGRGAGDRPDRGETVGVDAARGDRAGEVVDRVGGEGIGADVPAGVRVVTEVHVRVVLVHGRHHHQREDDETEHGDRHAGAAGSGSRVGDGGADGRQRAAEETAQAANAGEQQVGVMDDQHGGADHHEDPGEEEHLHVAVERAEELLGDVHRQHPERQQGDADQASRRAATARRRSGRCGRCRAGAGSCRCRTGTRCPSRAPARSTGLPEE